ncbi:MAG: C-lysozyme inhibitor [Ideonella sp. MAG2]|nr:MAG: C-lysozyme inhibitor [Ideonella sp. MAG2]
MTIKTILALSAAITAATALSASPAEPGSPWTLSKVLADREAKAAFDRMSKGQKLPAWVSSTATQTEGLPLKFAGQDAFVLHACKPHACSTEQVALMYLPQTRQMYGVLRKAGPKQNAEHLMWLNQQGGPESIDGKTILYAALTGSLSNHPRAFDFASAAQ